MQGRGRDFPGWRSGDDFIEGEGVGVGAYRLCLQGFRQTEMKVKGTRGKQGTVNRGSSVSAKIHEL